MPTTVQEIIEKYLRENGYDGLAYGKWNSSAFTCSCNLDAFMHCDYDFYCSVCVAGYQGPDPRRGNPARSEGLGGFFIYPTREAADEAKATAVKEQECQSA